MFTFTGDTTGYTVLLLGSNDPQITGYMLGQINGVNSWETIQKGWPTAMPVNVWVKIPGPSEQSSGGASANPMVGASDAGATFAGNGPFKVVRAVLIGNDGSSAAPASVNADLVP